MKKFNSSKVCWGVIGAGSVCEKKSAPAMNKITDSSVIAVMRRNAEKAKDYAERHGVPKWYADADELINDPEVNAIYIATPPNSHLELTKKAVEAGKPVYVEKPMARNHEECLEMIKICEEAGVPLFVAYYRRTLPNFLKVKSLIEEGAIGDPRYVNIVINQSKHPDVIKDESNWRIDPEVAGGGYFYDLGSHQLDYLDFLFGPMKEVNGVAANQSGDYPAEDIVLGNFIFESGVLGSGNWCFTTGETSQKDEIVIIGNKGEIRFPCFWGTSVTLKRDGKADEVFEFEMPENIQFFLIQSIVNELLGKGGECPSTGVSAARTNWAMEQMIKNFN
ncbi:Gfo/Idh/MocA family oxidoreductase [Cyclobacterium sp. 1_MG-2023]|uniref:Gfo/Idh/MocA family protein n=1 Tax=Cyclobacterium sp. 1_MG-2023 TaxID=3062681 RepID=UPI0026E12EBC|nr:Gfo/Idh/MocA family oxidoreductase [Cyclobacterium sp. 1_MG-2023]MDO6436896.1 Gfo/Idh/MocA family oxidoreductase [Cyclobacterium sp. 1_MG-2023]